MRHADVSVFGCVASEDGSEDGHSEKDFNWCRQQFAQGRKIIFVLYANDHENDLTHLNYQATEVHPSLETAFQLKPIDVQDERQLSLLRRVQPQLTCQLSTLVCILISGVMSNLINCETSAVAQCLAAYCTSARPDSATSDDDRMAPLYALYDEPNEINMIRVKFRLRFHCVSEVKPSSGSNQLRRHIVLCAVRLCNETLLRRHTAADQTSGNEQDRKALFKVFPKTIDEVSWHCTHCEDAFAFLDRVIADDGHK